MHFLTWCDDDATNRTAQTPLGVANVYAVDHLPSLPWAATAPWAEWSLHGDPEEAKAALEASYRAAVRELRAQFAALDAEEEARP